jgi:ornithine decarboxylase
MTMESTSFNRPVAPDRPIDLGSALSVAELNDMQHQTPFFVFDLDKIRLQHQSVKDALQGFEIFYALKANPAVPIVKTLAGEGCSFEVASYFELEKLMDAGVDAASVLYSNPVKPPDHIEAAHAVGLYRFAFDSVNELEKIATAAPGSRVYLRLHVDDRSSQFPLSSKFGAPPHEALPLFRRARKLGLVPYGITFHVGSQATSLDVWDSAIRLCGTVIKDLEAEKLHIDWLDIGGGFPAAYSRPVPSMLEVGRAIQRSVDLYIPSHLALAAEPGRVMVAETGVLATTVIGREDRHGETWLHLDAGALNGMMEALQAHGKFPFPVTSSLSGKGFEERPFTLTGPTCDSHDTMMHDVSLPGHLGVGDRVYIMSAGAYSLSYGGSFNGFAAPEAIFMNDSDAAFDFSMRRRPPSRPRGGF